MFSARTQVSWPPKPLTWLGANLPSQARQPLRRSWYTSHPGVFLPDAILAISFTREAISDPDKVLPEQPAWVGISNSELAGR